MKQVHFYICVPVYNTEKFLKKCVNSVIYQDYSNWTMIIVDDGSPDNSGVICDEFAKHHSNIIVVHQENEGRKTLNSPEICNVNIYPFFIKIFVTHFSIDFTSIP